MPLEPSEIFHMESPRLAFQLFRSQMSRVVRVKFSFEEKHNILLICPWKVVEYIKKGFDIELREDGGGVEERMGSLRVI